MHIATQHFSTGMGGKTLKDMNLEKYYFFELLSTQTRAFPDSISV